MSEANLKVIKQQPDQDVIDYLEKCLTDAKAGRLQEFCLVGRFENNSTLSCWAGFPDDAFKMFGKLMDMALDYRERNIHKSCDENDY